MSVSAFPCAYAGAKDGTCKKGSPNDISDAGAANDFASQLDRVSAGAEVIIERNSRPVAVVRPAESAGDRLLSESIALAEAHAKELGYEPTRMLTSPRTLERSLKAANRVTSPHGTDSRLQHPHSSGTRWRECPSNPQTSAGNARRVVLLWNAHTLVTATSLRDSPPAMRGMGLCALN